MRWWRIVIWGVVAAAIAGGGIVASSHASSAEDDLAAIRQFVREHPSYRSSTTSGRSVTESEQSDEEHQRTTTSFSGEDGRYETIRIGRTTYTRLSDRRQWERYDQDEDSDDLWFNYAPNSGIAFGGSDTDGPLDLLDGHRFTFVRDGDHRLLARYRMRDVAPQLDDDLGVLPAEHRADVERFMDSEVELVLEHTGPRLDAISSRSDVSTSTTRYRDWGAPITITAPTDVDPTPTIDEDALAGFEPGPVLAPTDLPDGWTLLSSYVADDEECRSASLDYAEAEDDLSVASVVTVARDCASFDPDDVSEIAYTDEFDCVTAVREVAQGWVVVAAPDDATAQRLLASLAPYRP